MNLEKERKKIETVHEKKKMLLQKQNLDGNSRIKYFIYWHKSSKTFSVHIFSKKGQGGNDQKGHFC